MTEAIPEGEKPAVAPEQLKWGAGDEYAVVEIFGHRRHVGRILEVDRFGAKMLRIDVPGDGKFENGFTTHYYGGSSVFSLTPCDRVTVERLNASASAPPAGRLTYRAPDDDDGEF